MKTIELELRGALRGILCAIILLVIACLPANAASKISIVVSTNDLGSIAAGVGGDQVEIVGICKAGADPHHVEVLPSYMVRVARAQLYLKVGLGLDQWADQIVDGSHSRHLVVVDCSKGVHVLERPTGKVDASMGDVHPDGNPHYWLDPANGAIVAHTVAEALGRADPAHAAEFSARADEFDRAAQALAVRGRELTGAMASRNIITYHRSWSYLADAFGLTVLSNVEPVPGIPPTGRHLSELVSIIKGQKASVLLQEPYFSADAGKFLHRETGIRVVTMAAACDAPVAGSYFGHLDALLAALAGPTAGGSAPAGK